MADAKDHMDRGQAAFLAKNYAEAAGEFRTAYGIRPFSTFLFNEGVCQEKLRNFDEAIRLFQKYVEVDPGAPDRSSVERRIERLQAERTALAAVAPIDADGGVDAPAPPPPPPTDLPSSSIDEMRSIAVIESLPDGAPVEIWAPAGAESKSFVLGSANPGWTKVASGTTPFHQSLPLGLYHVVIPKFQDYRATETDVVVAAATLSIFKANLAQGAFYGILKVRSYEIDGGPASTGAPPPGNAPRPAEPPKVEVRGARVLVKRPGESRFVDRGVTPYEESLESGRYVVRLERPGFTGLEKEVQLEHGKLDELKLVMTRSEDGVLRVDVTGADQAEVEVDGTKVGTFQPGKPVETTLRAGSHVVRVSADDRKTYKATLDVGRGRMVVLHADLRPKVPRGSAWTTAVASAIFIGGGIFLGLESNAYKRQLDRAVASGRLDQDDDRILKGQYFAIGADVAFAAGGILGLVSLYNFVRDPLPDSRGWTDAPQDLDPKPSAARGPTARLVPSFGPHQTFLTLTGEF